MRDECPNEEILDGLDDARRTFEQFEGAAPGVLAQNDQPDY